MWLEENVPLEKVSEVSGAKQLENFRMSQKECKGLSFEPISGSGPNGAVIHYRFNMAMLSL